MSSKNSKKSVTAIRAQKMKHAPGKQFMHNSGKSGGGKGKAC